MSTANLAPEQVDVSSQDEIDRTGLSPGRANKILEVRRLHEVFMTAGIVVVARYAGLTVPQMQDLRGRARKAGGTVKVAKMTLTKIAARDTSYAGLDDFLYGQNLLAYAENPVSVAQAMVAFAKTNNNFEILGGIMGATPLTVADVETLASLPSLDDLRAKLIRLLDAPARKLALVLGAPSVKLARVVQAGVDAGRAGPFEDTARNESWTSGDLPGNVSNPASRLVAKLSSEDPRKRTEGIRETSRYLSVRKTNSGTNDVPQVSGQRSKIERLEASTLPARLYDRLFSADDHEAREAAYALVANASAHRGTFDPALSSLELPDDLQAQFRTALVEFLFDVNLHYFSHVNALACDLVGSDRIGVHVMASVTRKVPFKIGGQDVFLRNRAVRSGTLNVDCPLAESVKATQLASHEDDDGLVAVGGSYIVLRKDRVTEGRMPVVVSFDQAIETVSVDLPAAREAQGA